MKKTLLLLGALAPGLLLSQSPELDSWIINTTGYNATYWDSGNMLQTMTDEADCQEVCYTNDSVWIQATGLTTFMGVWTNPGGPSDQSHIYRIPRNPVVPGTKTAVPTVFAIGALINGIPIFGMGDDKSYNSGSGTNEQMGDGIWYTEAWANEGSSLDTMGCHPNQDGTFHTHASAQPLWIDYPTNVHSPIIGWSFDGYPIYGPYGYSDPNDGNSNVTRMETSWQLRNITDRTTLPNGGGPSMPPGPSNFTSFPLGTYIQDYEYVMGLGDLDEYNGRTCVTPEYPGGTYAYFTTVDASLAPAFPFFIGVEYYGAPDVGNHAMSSVTWPASCTPVGIIETASNVHLNIYPNPSDDMINIDTDHKILNIKVLDLSGKTVYSGMGQRQIDVSGFTPGLYILNIETPEGMSTSKIIIE